MIFSNLIVQRCAQLLFSTVFLLSAGLSHAEWNADWPVRNKVSINPQALGLSEPAVALMRLHSGNFDFTNVNIDGSDIRVIAADDHARKLTVPFKMVDDVVYSRLIDQDAKFS